MADIQDRIHAYLKDRTSGASPEEVASEVLKLRGGNPAVFEKVVGAALREDARFVRASDGRWRLAPPRRTPPARQAPFTAIALKVWTPSNRVAEIGAVRVAEGDVREGFFRAVAPDLPPGSVSRRGEESVPVREALADLTAFISESTLVADDLPATLSLLAWEARRSGAPRLPAGGLSLRRLGRRLFPGQRVRAVGDLTGLLGLSRLESGRADRDAATVGSTLVALLERCRKQGVVSLDEVLSLQEPDLEGVDFSRYTFDRDHLR